MQVSGRRWPKLDRPLHKNGIIDIIKKRYITSTTAPILSQILQKMTFTGLGTTARVDLGEPTRSVSAAGFAQSMIERVIMYCPLSIACACGDGAAWMVFRIFAPPLMNNTGSDHGSRQRTPAAEGPYALNTVRYESHFPRFETSPGRLSRSKRNLSGIFINGIFFFKMKDPNSFADWSCDRMRSHSKAKQNKPPLGAPTTDTCKTETSQCGWYCTLPRLY